MSCWSLFNYRAIASAFDVINESVKCEWKARLNWKGFPFESRSEIPQLLATEPDQLDTLMLLQRSATKDYRVSSVREMISVVFRRKNEPKTDREYKWASTAWWNNKNCSTINSFNFMLFFSSLLLLENILLHSSLVLLTIPDNTTKLLSLLPQKFIYSYSKRFEMWRRRRQLSSRDTSKRVTKEKNIS